MSMIRSSAGSSRSFWRLSRGLLIAFPSADDPLSGNHESLKSKIQKRKKARSNTTLSCKIQYYIKHAFAYFSGQAVFFTDDSIGNLAANDRAALFLMDYPNRARLKILAHVEIKDLKDDSDL